MRVPTWNPASIASFADSAELQDLAGYTWYSQNHNIGGYYILECPNLDAALALAAQIPSSAYGSTEVRPLMEIPGE